MAKNKMKNHKAAAKRYKLTGSGKLVRAKSGRSHLNTKMSSATKRRLDSNTVMNASSVAKVLVELPYLKYIR